MKSGSALHKQLVAERPRSLIDRAVRFFVLNRITFSGTIEAGGFSQSAFEKRFTQSAIDRLTPVASLLSTTKFSNEDYEGALLNPGENVVVFLDPPYISATKSRLYGKQGILHTTFDHERFASLVKRSKHKWMITYDDSDEVRTLFSFGNFHEWTLQYGMNNFRQATAAAGKELIITNFSITASRESRQ
jgi:DNA adenine methylase